MPGPIYYGSTRLVDFDDYLRANSIPINGVSQTADAPEGVAIDFQEAATVEQISWANNAKTAFDWRKRRLRSLADLYANFSGLTTAERANLQARGFAIVAQTNPSLMAQMLLAAGIDLPLTEVDPNP